MRSRGVLESDFRRGRNWRAQGYSYFLQILIGSGEWVAMCGMHSAGLKRKFFVKQNMRQGQVILLWKCFYRPVNPPLLTSRYSEFQLSSRIFHTISLDRLLHLWLPWTYSFSRRREEKWHISNRQACDGAQVLYKWLFMRWLRLVRRKKAQWRMDSKRTCTKIEVNELQYTKRKQYRENRNAWEGK